jgi:hypothetical protein
MNAGVEILLTTVEFGGGEPAVEEGFNHVYRIAARSRAIRDRHYFSLENNRLNSV